MRFEKVWVEQCRATKTIKRHFGAKSALDYLIGEKLMNFADAARDDPAFARELPRFLAAVSRTFNEYEIAGYIASRSHPGTLRPGCSSPERGADPPTSCCGHHGRSPLIQTGNRPADRSAIIRFEFDDHPDRKPGELDEAVGGAQQLQTFDDAPIQPDQISFR